MQEMGDVFMKIFTDARWFKKGRNKRRCSQLVFTFIEYRNKTNTTTVEWNDIGKSIWGHYPLVMRRLLHLRSLLIYFLNMLRELREGHQPLVVLQRVVLD